MARQLLIETIVGNWSPIRMPSPAGKSITEGVLDSSSMDLVLNGLAIQGEVRNHNGRIYPKEEIASAVRQIMEKILRYGPVIGECDHPDTMSIALDRSTHVITSMQMVGADGHASFSISDEGLGRIIRGLVRIGWKPGVSSRGLGNVDSNGYVSDFDITTIDMVANPSAPDAFLRPIVESYRDSSTGRRVSDLSEAIRHDPAARVHLERSILDFINELRGS